MSVSALFVIALLAAIGASGQTVAVKGVTVVNPRDRTVHSNKTVIVEGTRIRAVQANGDRVPRGARVIDASGKFVIPGLWDSHVHLTKAGELSLPLFVANGVTAVRDMGSDLRQVSAWRAEIEAGKRLGPRIKSRACRFWPEPTSAWLSCIRASACTMS